MPVNIDTLPADTPTDEFGFPVLPKKAPETLPGATLADMTNDYKHLRGRFWTRAMRMKQQKAIVRLAAKMQGVADPAVIMDTVTEMAMQVVFVEEGEQYRPATADELDEEFTVVELQELTGDVTGIKSEGGGSSKNAAPQIGASSTV